MREGVFVLNLNLFCYETKYVFNKVLHVTAIKQKSMLYNAVIFNIILIL